MLLLIVIAVSLFFLISLLFYAAASRNKASQVRSVRHMNTVQLPHIPLEPDRTTAADALYDALQGGFGAKFDVLCDVHQSELEEGQLNPGLTRTNSLARHHFALASKTTGDIKLVVTFGTGEHTGRIARAVADKALVVKLPLRETYTVEEVKRDILTQVKTRRKASSPTSKPQDPDAAPPRAVIEAPSQISSLN